MKKVLVLLSVTFALIAFGNARQETETKNVENVSEIKLIKPQMRWLWGGFGFHNSEATMTSIMSEDFLNQRVLKTFLEISPTISRVFAGYHDWSKKSMDDFADYYDKTFRKAGTTLYLVPGRMPYIDKDFDVETYTKNSVERLEYLVKERNLTKLRYYCITNEGAVGNKWGWFNKNLDLYKTINEHFYREFKRKGLDIGLAAFDTSGIACMKYINWATENMDEITDIYCWHFYITDMKAGDLSLYSKCCEPLNELVKVARRKEKRLMLGEFGFMGPKNYPVMYDDANYSFKYPEEANLAAISRAEMGLAALNTGCHSAINWTLFDYPDPFFRENGDSQEEKNRYEVSKFSGHGLQIRYNKNGLVKWCDDEKDYSARPAMYTVGYLAKLFRKGSRVLPYETKDNTLRVGAVTNADGSGAIAIINWGYAKTVKITSEHKFTKPLRLYMYDSANVPQNEFGDLQDVKELVSPKDNIYTISMPKNSMVFLTSDYEDREPSQVKKIKVSDGRLTWKAVADPEHRYYRVYYKGKQIASTVAENVKIKEGKASDYQVKSVDKWGNCRKN